MLRKLTILFYSRPRPPWVEINGQPAKKTEYSIPDVRPGLTWKDIKTAARQFQWGRFRATAKLSNQRQMAVYGATAQEARGKLRELLTLSTAEILTLSVSEEEDRDPRLKKQPTLVYPAFVTLLARRSNTGNDGRVMIDGRDLDEKVARVPLWTDDEPVELLPFL